MTTKGFDPIAVVLSLLAATLPLIALADDKTDLAANQVRNFDSPSANTAGANATTKASVKAAGDNSAASSQLSHAWPVQAWDGLFVGRVLAAAPFSDSNAPKPDTGSVSSLSAGVNARLDANFLWLPTDKKTTVDAYQATLNAICNAYIRAVFGPPYYYIPPAGLQLPADDPKGDYVINFQSSHSCYELLQPDVMNDLVTELNAAIDKRNAIVDKLNKEHGLAAAKEKVLALPSNWSDIARATYEKLQIAEKPHFSLLQSAGLSFLGNQHTNSFVTTAAPSKITKESDEGYGIGLNYTALLRHMSIIVGYSYERPFMTGKGQQICSPVGTSTSTTCSTAAVGAPVRTTARIASLETRVLFGSALAIAPRVEYDTVAANLGVKLPLYFVADAKKILTGGLEVGWTKSAGYQGAVVLEKAFSFLD
jgi:hypothetical protein